VPRPVAREEREARAVVPPLFAVERDDVLLAFARGVPLWPDAREDVLFAVERDDAARDEPLREEPPEDALPRVEPLREEPPEDAALLRDEPPDEARPPDPDPDRRDDDDDFFGCGMVPPLGPLQAGP
jgi:hypothetical protein